VQEAVRARFAPAAGRLYADQRLISLRSVEGDPSHFHATIFDYGSEKGYELVLDAAGNEIERRVVEDQPARALDELRDAAAIVEGSSIWSKSIASGAVEMYQAMPAVTVGPDGRRLINVGIIGQLKDRILHGEGGGDHSSEGADLDENEVVSVDIPTG